MIVKKNILIVENNGDLQNAIAKPLALHGGFVSLSAKSGGEVIQKLQEQHVEMVLIDVDLADIDGRELCRLIRRQGIKSPIILVGDAKTDADIILGLDSGASDYITRPFPLGVLLARLRAQLRQVELFDDITLPIKHHAFRPSTKILTDTETEKKIHLTEREAAILKYLYRMGNRPAPRKTLLGEVWGYKSGVTTHTLESHIYRLRQKIERDPANVKILVTEPEGYRLVR